MLHGDITDKVLREYYRVYNQLGYGFLEKVYENALKIACQEIGLGVAQQTGIDVYFDGVQVGYYVADLIVEGKVIVEVKAVDSLRAEHEAQLLNYLRATPYEVGLLLNFGKRAEFKRKIFRNALKKPGNDRRPARST